MEHTPPVTVDRFPAVERELWAVGGIDTDEPARLEGWAVTYRREPNFAGRILVPGVFTDSLAQRPTTQKPLPMGYEHSTFSGTNPIGHWREAHDDPDRGLMLREGFVSNTSLGRDVTTLVRDGVLNGLSVGFIAQSVKYGEPGETCEFKTPFGTRAYEVGDEDVVFVSKAILLETSVVSTPADDEARMTRIQSVSRQAVQALPGLGEDADWDDLAYSMALLMGGRGAGAFSDLPELERVAFHQRLAQGYARHGRTPPPYQSTPDFRTVRFQHDERQVFSDRYLTKTLATAAAGAEGLQGPLSREACAMALRFWRAITPNLGQLSPAALQIAREFRQELEPHLHDADPQAIAELEHELRQTLDLVRSER